MLLLALALAQAVADPSALLRRQDETLARVGYRLASRGAALCLPTGHPAGLVVERASLYPQSARGQAGVDALPTVAVVVPGSPAAEAGLKVGDRLTAIEGQAIAPEDVTRVAVGYAPTAAVRARIDAALADGRTELGVTSSTGTRTVRIDAPAGCAAEFAVRPGGKLNSYSDGTIVQITSGVVAFTRSDAELAAVVAHELSHNILRHPQSLAASGRSRSAVKRTEVEAERLSVYLLALAGYPLDEAFALRDRLGRQTDWGILGDGTHPSRKETQALLATERARIEAMVARGEPIRPPADLAPRSAAVR